MFHVYDRNAVRLEDAVSLDDAKARAGASYIYAQGALVWMDARLSVDNLPDSF